MIRSRGRSTVVKMRGTVKCKLPPGGCCFGHNQVHFEDTVDPKGTVLGWDVAVAHYICGLLPCVCWAYIIVYSVESVPVEWSLWSL